MLGYADRMQLLRVLPLVDKTRAVMFSNVYRTVLNYDFERFVNLSVTITTKGCTRRTALSAVCRKIQVRPN